MTARQALGSQTTVRASIDLNSGFDATFLTMNVLATVIACYGLFENSSAVVIGAMIIAMLLGPISGIALGLVEGNNRLFRKALATLAGGVAVVYGTAFILGLVHSEFPLTSEIYARTTPNVMDLMIALAGGAAGAYAMITPRLNLSFVGVAISTALVPPLSSSAICMARGEYRLGLYALLLAFANIVGIQVAGSIVMWVCGYRGEGTKMQASSALRRNFLSVTVLCVLAILLSLSLLRVVVNEVYETSVRKILRAEAATHKGAYLAEVRFPRSAGRNVVVAVYRTPEPFTPEDVSVIEPKLPLRPGEQSVELRIRSIPVTAASKSGYLYSSEDLTEYDLRSEDDRGR
jgi:uncharacterized hydrophobic protein (TIGR00271 family)